MAIGKANQGILYVDEVNLLDDHLVDVLLIQRLLDGLALSGKEFLLVTQQDLFLWDLEILKNMNVVPNYWIDLVCMPKSEEKKNLN